MMDLSHVGWRKSSYSGGGNACVEVGRIANDPAVRDTKDREGGRLTATAEQWSAFVDAIKAGRFDC